MKYVPPVGGLANDPYVDANPVGGIEGSPVPAAAIENPMREIEALIVDAGLVPSNANLAQLVAATRTLIQKQSPVISAAGGTANALTAAYTPAITALTNGMTLFVRPTAANSTTTPTFTPASGVVAAKAIVKGNGQALLVGDIAGAGHWLHVQYDSALDKWVLLNPARGVTDLLNGQPGSYYAPLASVALVFNGELSGGVDLDTLTTGGLYYQGNNTEAASGFNYPVPQAGKLEVYSSLPQFCFQNYHLYNTGRVFTRGYYEGTWSAWVELSNSAPAGEVAFFAKNTAPAGYLKANGAAISRTTYATLFAAIGPTFGGGDGSTTFNLPDLRGEFVRGWDDARGVDAGRGFGSFQKGTFHNIGSGPVVDCVTDYSVSNGGAAAAADLGLDTGVPSDYPNARYGSAGTVGPSGAPMYTDASYGVTRPRNIALLACIKY